MELMQTEVAVPKGGSTVRKPGTGMVWSARYESPDGWRLVPYRDHGECVELDVPEGVQKVVLLHD